MTKRMKHRLGWIVLAGVLLFTIALLVIGLISARTRAVVALIEKTAVQTELAEVQSALNEAEEQEQIEVFLQASVVLYTDGDKKAAMRFLEYAIYKMDERDRKDLHLLPAKMLRDPLIAKKLGLKVAKGPQRNTRRFGGG